MESVTVYQKPTCTTCRKVSKALEEKGVSFDTINYYIEPEFTKIQKAKFSMPEAMTLLKGIGVIVE